MNDETPTNVTALGIMGTNAKLYELERVIEIFTKMNDAYMTALGKNAAGYKLDDARDALAELVQTLAKNANAAITVQANSGAGG